VYFGGETWICNKREESKLQAAEMKFSRRIVGKNRRDRIRNIYLGRAQDRGNTEPDREKYTEMVWTC
jgi:hypothetical protein